MDVDLIMPSHIAGLTQFFAILANYRSESDARWILNQSPSIVSITAQGMTYLFNTMHEKEVKDWYAELGLEKWLQLCYHVTSRAHWFVGGNQP